MIPDSSRAAEVAWYDRVELTGDVRLRYESIRDAQSADRDRGRFRARLGIAAMASEDIRLVVRLATGDGSPVSTNLTFGDGFSGKEINFDRAYVDWRIDDRWHLLGGKIKSPWFRSGGNALLWDSDLNPEGVAAVFSDDRYFGSVAVLSVSDRSDADGSLLLSAQGGISLALGDASRVSAGIGYHEYTDTIGNEPFYDGRAKGNSVDASGNYLFDYSLLEFFAEFKTKFGNWPLTVFGNRVQNREVRIENTGYVVGAKLGSADAAGTMHVSYSWQDTEADAVIGTFNDSDFAGGNTDARGHLLKGEYAVRDHVLLGATIIIAERGGYAGKVRDYDRVMLDIGFSFE